MSSSLWREPLSGTIRQDSKVIGAICLPETELQEFIDQFNHCYGPMRLHIEQPKSVPPPVVSAPLIPVGSTHRRPFRVPQPGFRPLPFDK